MNEPTMNESVTKVQVDAEFHEVAPDVALAEGVPFYLVFDTETTGLFDFKQPADAEGQPRMASAAFIVADLHGTMLSASRHLIKPDGWEMPPEAEKINGLSTDILMRDGQPVSDVLDIYEKYALDGLTVCAFNAQFDTKVLRAEFRRAGRDDMFERTPNFCLMRGLHPYGADGLPIMRGFIKLREACKWFGFAQDAEHDAMSDAVDALHILQRMIADDRVPEAKVHYAKNRPEGSEAK